MLVQHVVVVIAMPELNLLIISVNLLAECLWSTEVKRCTFNLQNLTCRNSGVVGRQIEVGIDLADLILNGWSGICCTSQTEECVMSQIDYGLLVGGSQILDDQFVKVCEGKLYVNWPLQIRLPHRPIRVDK